MSTYAGIDLHSSNNYIGIIDDHDQRLYGRRLPNDLNRVLAALKPFQDTLEAVVVESTFNWYWLVDGLQEHGYKLHLANPAAMVKYSGLKHSDDQSDSYWLAHMKRLNLLPEGYIYPKKDRPVRDLLRRRLLFVKQRTSQILSLKSMVYRNLGKRIGVNWIKQLKEKDADKMFKELHLSMASGHSIATIRFLGQRIKSMEKAILNRVRLKPEFSCLLTTPGIGNILGLTIMLEVGDIGRFPKVGKYTSYCRCVTSQWLTNNKRKGSGNRKNGNRYLAWAYVEAAHFAARYSMDAQRFYQRKKARTCEAVAVKALAHKLARATYYIMRDQVPFDECKLFR